MQQDKQATAEQASAVVKGFRQRGAVDRDLYCSRLDAYLGGSAAAHGFRGTLASVTASIERGGVGGGGEDPNLAMLRRLGWQEGRHEEFDPLRRPTYVLGPLRESEARFRMLSVKHQGTHLAHYLGTSRCHPTLLATFGDLDGGGVAGVVLERWLTKKAKERSRSSDGKHQAALEALRAELAPIEHAIAEAQAILDQPPLPEPEAPENATKAELRALRAPWHAARRAAQEARQDAEWRRDELLVQVAPLRAEQARLCAEDAASASAAASAATKTGVNDEQALVALCQKLNEQGQEGRERRDDMIRAAEADVRAAHRAWRDTAKKTAKVWLEAGEPAA